MSDPRHGQLALQGVLLALGAGWLHFDVSLTSVLTTTAAALVTQWACLRLWRVPSRDLTSAFVTAGSLALLLRSMHPWAGPVAAVVAIASKFLLRADGRHMVNPSLAGLLLLTGLDLAWVSPGQWGSASLWALLIGGGAWHVLHHSRRSDVPVTFLLTWSGLFLARALWLGDPLTIWAHQLRSGTVLLFALFMITDPRTSPDDRLARIAWTASVAAVGFVLQVHLWINAGPLWALLLLAPTVPLLNRRRPARAFTWRSVAIPASK